MTLASRPIGVRATRAAALAASAGQSQGTTTAEPSTFAVDCTIAPNWSSVSSSSLAGGMTTIRDTGRNSFSTLVVGILNERSDHANVRAGPQDSRCGLQRGCKPALRRPGYLAVADNLECCDFLSSIEDGLHLEGAQFPQRCTTERLLRFWSASVCLLLDISARRRRCDSDARAANGWRGGNGFGRRGCWFRGGRRRCRG
jgi:hypothetical protein